MPNDASKHFVTFGEVMLRLKSPGFERFMQKPLLESTFGGAEANTAVGLAHFGCTVSMVTVLPQNPIADACIGELRRHGVDVSYILRQGNRMGIYFIEGGNNQRPSSIVYDRSGSAMAEVRPGDIAWGDIFKRASWFHISGITPALSSSAADASLEAVREAKKAGVTVSCDLNYRKKLWQYGKKPREIMETIATLSDVVVGNEEDYQKSLGLESGVDVERDAMKTQDFAQLTETVFRRYGDLQAAAVTLRSSHSATHNTWQAVLRTRGGFHVSRSYEIRSIVDRVGAGDAFSSGLIYGMNTGMDDAAALEYAAAAGCLKHTIPGDYPFLSVDDVHSLVSGTGSGRIQR
jgi:2-dehydro-3-deoxygluconokinase